MNLQDSIKSIDFFKSLNQEEIEKLCEMSYIKKYSKDSILYYENELTNNLMFVITGVVKVYKLDKYDNEIFLYYIMDKAVISYFTSLEQDEVLCFANTGVISDAQILFVNFNEFKQNFLFNNILTLEFAEEVLKRNRKLQFIINRELVFNSTAKVAYMLHSDLEGFNAHKRQEVSFLLHIQPETLSRVLKRLSRDGLINIESGDVTIVDKQGLVAIFGGITQ